MAKKVAVLIKEKERQYEGLRTSLGLLMEFHIVSMIVLNHEIELTEEYKDNMEFIDEMEGTRYSNVPANVEKYGFESLGLEEIPKKLGENDVIIPF
ncbi:MAG: hypothetical protein OET63_09560 [Desulfobacterales bacterium]|jgi:hypothetical protein|nr:hypothetical protein [Desulfobacterales bacterium]